MLVTLQSLLDMQWLPAHDPPMGESHEPRLRNRIKVARAERDLSQDQLARAAGVSRQTISSIETGQYCPSTLLAFRLARVLRLGVEDLFQLEEGER